jgi:hypothetical protein
MTNIGNRIFTSRKAMKLSTIANEHSIPTNVKLNYLCGNCVCEGLNNKSIQELFIESVATADLITEAQASALAVLFKSQLAKLQAALAPKTTEDLKHLLTFVAPQGGGIAQVDNLIKLAKQTRGNILSNTKWWDELFKTFNVTDKAVKQSVLQQFAKSQPTDSPIATPRQSKSSDFIGNIKRGFQSAMNPSDDAGLARNREMRADSDKRLAALAKRLEELQNESIANYARTLLEFPQIIKHLTTLVETMARSSGGKYITINEAGLPERAKQTMGRGLFDKLGENVSDLVNNPKRAETRYQKTYDTSTNERIAKLAIQTLTDIVRDKFETALETKNITPQQVMTAVEKYQDYKQRLQITPDALSAEEQADYARAREKLQYISKIFEEPITAEIVDEPVAEPFVPDEPITSAEPPPAQPIIPTKDVVEPLTIKEPVAPEQEETEEPFVPDEPIQQAEPTTPLPQAEPAAPTAPEEPEEIEEPFAPQEPIPQAEPTTPLPQEEPAAPIAPEEQEEVEEPFVPDEPIPQAEPIAPLPQEEPVTPIAPEEQEEIEKPFAPQEPISQEPAAPTTASDDISWRNGAFNFSPNDSFYAPKPSDKGNLGPDDEIEEPFVPDEPITSNEPVTSNEPDDSDEDEPDERFQSWTAPKPAPKTNRFTPTQRVIDAMREQGVISPSVVKKLQAHYEKTPNWKPRAVIRSLVDKGIISRRQALALTADLEL